MNSARPLKPRIMVLFALISSLAIADGRPASATSLGVVFTDSNFSGAVPAGYSGSSDFDPCEFNRYSSGGDHYQHIYSYHNDTCAIHTPGAPSGGDVSIHKNFSASATQFYKAYAIASTSDPSNAVAQVKVLFKGAGGSAIGECYGTTASTTFVTIDTGQSAFGNNGNPKPFISADGGCQAPAGTNEVAVHFRIHSQGSFASGKAILRKLRFGRCYDGGGCGNVPAP